MQDVTLGENPRYGDCGVTGRNGRGQKRPPRRGSSVLLAALILVGSVMGAKKTEASGYSGFFVALPHVSNNKFTTECTFMIDYEGVCIFSPPPNEKSKLSSSDLLNDRNWNPKDLRIARCLRPKIERGLCPLVGNGWPLVSRSG
jgi:hypothetical protein